MLKHRSGDLGDLACACASTAYLCCQKQTARCPCMLECSTPVLSYTDMQASRRCTLGACRDPCT